MKLFNFVPAVLLAACAGQAAAAGPDDVELVPMAYMSMPLGKQAGRKDRLQFGLGFASAEYERNTGVNFMNTGKARLFDLSFTGNEFRALEINGMNAVERTVIRNADGTTTTGATVNYHVIVPAVIGGSIILFEALEDDDNPAPPPPPPQS